MAVIRDSNTDSARGAVVLDLSDLAAQGKKLRESAEKQAREIVEAALVQRKKLIDTATEEGLERGHAQGYADGYRDGRELGTTEAIARVGEDVQQLNTTLHDLLAQFSGKREELLVSAREDVVRIAILFAQRLVARVIDIDPGVAARRFEQILPLVLRPSRLSVRVHPDDQMALQSVLPDLSLQFEQARDTQIIADPSLQRGSCVVSSAGGAVIDASIATQMEELACALLPDAERHDAFGEGA
ncbi:MAG: FliH/SctL family protein [Phycisphaerales bacterium]|jgi:flagellar biosynthesis/type III secretory pathway protein FliH